MNRIVISTVGTSLLTNQINRSVDKNNQGKSWYDLLRDTANLTEIETPNEIKEITNTLQKRAEHTLKNSQIVKIRRASAELNGIYGLYNGNLNLGKQDIHWLIATDTTQGSTTANIVESYLRSQGLMNVNTYTPSKLSTKETDSFLKGIAELINWMQETIPPYKKQNYQICFNLVGSFKSLQGYLNTIGMFYADEIIYIFEGENSELITIPRLPIIVNSEEIEPYKVSLAMMDVGEIPIHLEIAKNVPNNWIFSDGNQMTLSTWGQLLWNQCKDKLLSQKLLKFPQIEYTSTFKDDYKPKPVHEKIALQKQLARVSCLLNSKKNGISAVGQDRIFGLRKYEGKHNDIDHFNLPKGRRVSCLTQGNILKLRHYGEHDYVNNNP